MIVVPVRAVVIIILFLSAQTWSQIESAQYLDIQKF